MLPNRLASLLAVLSIHACAWPQDAKPSVAEDAATLEKMLSAGSTAKGERPKEILFFGILGSDRKPTAQANAETLKKLDALAARVGANSLPAQTEPKRNRMALLAPNAASVAEEVNWLADPERLRVLCLQPPLAMSEAKAMDESVRLAGKGVQVGVLNLEGDGKPTVWRPTSESLKPFREERLSLPAQLDRTSEQPDLSPQAQGLAWSLNRASARHLEQPWLASLPVSSALQNPATLRRAFYQALGHGAKLFHFEGATLPSLAAKGGRSVKPDDAPLWLEIQRLIHETGAIERVISTAQPRQADIAFILSNAEEKRGHPQSMGEELKALYVACRQAGYAVDVLCDEDVQRGRLEKYRSAFIVGAHLNRKTAAEVKKWVEKGQCLGGYVGGGLWDEEGKLNEEMLGLYGIAEPKLEHPGELGAAKLELAQLQPLDSIAASFGEKPGRFPVLAAKLTFQAGPKSVVAGTYRDGSPAIVHTKNGGGHAYLFGSYIGSGWARGAMPKREWKPGPDRSDFNHFVPLDFDYEAADQAAAPADEARFHVVTDNLKVETLVLEGPKGVAVVCLNWARQPQTALLTVQFAQARFSKATSMERGPLKLTKIVDPNNAQAVTYTFRLKVDVADVVLIEE